MPVLTTTEKASYDTKVAEHITPEMFGATVNDPAYDIVTVWQSMLGDGRKIVLDDDIYFKTTTFFTCNNDVHITGKGKVFISTDVNIYFNNPYPAFTTLEMNLTRGDRMITVLNATGFTEGQTINISSDTNGESSWGTNKQDISSIKSIDGTNIYLDHPLNFDYLADLGETTPEVVSVNVYNRRKFYMNGIDYEHLSGGNLTGAFAPQHFSKVNISNSKMKGSRNHSFGYVIQQCLNTNIENIDIETMLYPVLLNGCRGANLDNISSIDTHHTIDCGEFTTDLYAKNIRGSRTDSPIGFHTGFNINVDGMVATDQLNGLAFRCCGGSLKNVRYDLAEDCEAVVSSYQQGTGFVNTVSDYYAEPINSFTYDNVTIVPNTEGQTFAINFNENQIGFVDKCDVDAINMGLVGTGTAQISNSVIRGTSTIRGDRVQYDNVQFLGNGTKAVFSTPNLGRTNYRTSFIANNCVFKNWTALDGDSGNQYKYQYFNGGSIEEVTELITVVAGTEDSNNYKFKFSNMLIADAVTLSNHNTPGNAMTFTACDIAGTTPTLP